MRHNLRVDQLAVQPFCRLIRAFVTVDSPCDNNIRVFRNKIIAVYFFVPAAEPMQQSAVMPKIQNRACQFSFKALFALLTAVLKRNFIAALFSDAF